MSKFDKIYAIDTNIILSDYTNIYKLSQDSKNLVVIPETVLDEIDAKKSGLEDINFQARSFARLLTNLEIITEDAQNDLKLITGKVDGMVILIISKDWYQVDNDNTSLSIYNDRKILEAVSELQDVDMYSSVKFITLDAMAKIRAFSIGIDTETLQLDSKEEELEHFRSVAVDKVPITTMELEGHKPETFSYEFRVPDGNKKFYIVQGTRFEEINESSYNGQSIKPKNLEQKFLSAAILSSFYNVISVNALAGSGKTLLSVSGAISLVKNKRTDYNQIIYVRNSIESLDKGEDVGYLPGLEEKFAIYNHPLNDVIDMIALADIKASNSNKSKAQEVEIDRITIEEKANSIKNKCNIETLWVGEARGRTFSNCVMILDESQNMSKKTMLTVLSRLDSTCKVIIIGSNNQIDNLYTNKHINGLTTVINSTTKLTDLVNIFAIKLHKVLRGPITEWSEEVFGS